MSRISQVLGALNYYKIFGKFGREINGTLRSLWKFGSGQSGPPLQMWSSLTVRSVRQPELTVPFPKILVSSPASLISKQNFGRNANGSLRFN